MKRREFITFLGSAAIARPGAVLAQPIGLRRRVGVLMSLAENDAGAAARVAILRQGLQELGWSDGRNIQIVFRWAGADAYRAQALARELVELQPDVIISVATFNTAALLKKTRTIPIVMVSVGDPVASGFVASLARPAGNATGITNYEASLGGKWFELLMQIAPRLDRIAIVFNPDTMIGATYVPSAQAAARRFAVDLIVVPVHDAIEIERALSTSAREPDCGLLVPPDPFTIVHRHQIIALAAHHRWPAIYGFNYFARSDGGLMSYGVDVLEEFRQAAVYVDRILKGAKPADLAVRHPLKFELIVNLTTAKTLGLTVPPHHARSRRRGRQMRRRDIISCSLGALASSAFWPLASRAQPSDPRRVGHIQVQASTDPMAKTRVADLTARLDDLGWKVNHNLQIDARFAAGDVERLRVLARELVTLWPDVIVTNTPFAIKAIRDQTDAIPIVFVQMADPVGAGLLKSVSRPENNITGFISLEYPIVGKWLQLLKQMAPEIGAVGLMVNPDAAYGGGSYWLDQFMDATTSLGMEPVAMPVRSTFEIQQAVGTLGARQNAGLLVATDSFTSAHHARIVELALERRIPGCYAFRYYTTEGGLMSYGPDGRDMVRRAASYVDRILRGESPANLPVQRPDKYELVINLKTAKALGLEVPRALLVRANEFIE